MITQFLKKKSNDEDGWNVMCITTSWAGIYCDKSKHHSPSMWTNNEQDKIKSNTINANGCH